MDKIINKEKGVDICIVPSCTIKVSEYGFLCNGHIELIKDPELKVVICLNCDSVARVVTPTFVGSTGLFWSRHMRDKYVYCEICRNCGATKEEEIYSTYNVGEL